MLVARTFMIRRIGELLFPFDLFFFVLPLFMVVHIKTCREKETDPRKHRSLCLWGRGFTQSQFPRTVESEKKYIWIGAL